ncbi:MAG: NADH:ubiquinone reductase (Na(+)-transporting) subunit B [Planctomycetota bacterium]
MKFLRDQLDRVEPLFTGDGPLKKAYPLYEAIDTFLFTPGIVTKSAAHIRDSLDMKRMMIMVVIALGPCFFMAMWNTGYQANLAIAKYDAEPYAGSITGLSSWGPLDSFIGPLDDREWYMETLGLEHDPSNHLSNIVYGALFFLPIYIVTMAVGGNIEAVFSSVRGHEINEGFLVTGALFPLSLSPTTPLWQVALAIAFGVIFAKEIFGGTGKNFLNVALSARAFLYFAYPKFQVGEWAPTGATQTGVWVAVTKGGAADAYSGATILTNVGSVTSGQFAAMSPAEKDKITSTVMSLDYSWFDCFMGWIPGSMGSTSALACLLGACLLIATGIGSWRIMAGVIGGAVTMSLMLFAFRDLSDNPMAYVPPHWHLVIGGLAFGLVFMATDPVSASMTDTGKLWYGGLIGVVTILIRVINPAYPEGIMLAILFGNVMAPLIDWAVIQANVSRRAVRYAA